MSDHEAEVSQARDAIRDALGGVELGAGMVALGQVSALMLAAKGDPVLTEQWIKALRNAIAGATKAGVSIDGVAEAEQTEH